MKRVYLDQNKWIDLGRALHQRAGGQKFLDVLDILRYATEQRLVSLPLSMAHYFETWKRGDTASRQRLGTLMYDLSKLDTMAGPSAMTPYEIELACHLLTGVPFDRPTIRVFGQGLGHACNVAAVDFDAPVNFDADTRAEIRRAAIEELERAAIVTAPFPLPAHGIARPSDEHGERYAETERESARRLEAEGFSKDLVRRFVFATELTDIMKPLQAALDRNGLTFDQVATEEESMTRFLQAMPTRWMTAHLRRAAFENRSNKWHAHDLNDIAYLAIAVVHCDIVVTERKWANYLASLPIDVPAHVITDLSDLPSHIVL